MPSTSLAGTSLLIVEDEYLIASNLMTSLEAAGARVFGPVSSVDQALEIIRGSALINGAILDINLQNEMAYPVAELSQTRQIPFVFVTGYECSSMPKEFSDMPCLTKPVDERELIALLVPLLPQNA
ncbi:CheY-like chemotaxis protein [Neorhizobium huautlense]|uniref:CheY-like chemotaxis protein n=1 Tax=Neorhizobium huautlense TaxID=67774 RepID=A0ABT9Q3H6_9HYPH|nr:response regulator [Neorhizobium huautlense]MDP9840634.1 CheY-like chemotaxis protein [Neorhizobium huautlense]